jgi:hypothetical protein
MSLYLPLVLAGATALAGPPAGLAAVQLSPAKIAVDSSALTIPAGRWSWARYGDRYLPAKSTARVYSRVIRAMFAMEISFGHTASHSPSLEQLPNPSLSAC